MRPEVFKMVNTVALVVLAICAIISTVLLGQLRAQTRELYNVTAKPPCYLSPNDARRREIEKAWGTQPTSEGTCDTEGKNTD